MTSVKDKYLVLLRKHVKSGGSHVSFAHRYQLNPSTVWAWSIGDGLTVPKPRQAVEVSKTTLDLLKRHLCDKGNIVEFAEWMGVNKSTVSRWATQLGFTTRIRWIHVSEKRTELMEKLGKFLSDGGTNLRKFSDDNDIPITSAYKWANDLGWAAKTEWVKSETQKQ